MRVLRFAAFLVALTLASSPAWARGKDAAERAARKACLTGDFAKGVEILAELFLDTGNLNYIFNQGRCLEQNRRYEDAIARFREYLVKGSSVSSEARADAEKHIAACQSYLGTSEPEKSAAVQPPPPPAAPPPAPEHVEAPTTASPAPSLHVVASAADARNPGGGLRAGGIITASVGAAALLAGVVLNLKVNSMSSDLEKPFAYNRSTDSTRETYKTMGWVAYGAGGAFIAAGAALYALGWSKARASSGEPTVSLAPSFASGATGLAMTGAF